MNKTIFPNKLTLRVQFHEVDLMGVCNNAIYFNYFETARVEYIKAAGFYRTPAEMQTSENFFLIVRNECDYAEPAIFDDELNIYTRVEFVKNSSFGFEHLVENAATGAIIARGKGVMVHINRASKRSIPLTEEIKLAISQYQNHTAV